MCDITPIYNYDTCTGVCGASGEILNTVLFSMPVTSIAQTKAFLWVEVPAKDFTAFKSLSYPAGLLTMVFCHCCTEGIAVPFSVVSFDDCVANTLVHIVET